MGVCLGMERIDFSRVFSDFEKMKNRKRLIIWSHLN